MLRHSVFVLTCLLTSFGAATTANARPQAGAPRLKVFLDCDCYAEFLRSEIQWVDFVRQREEADVHMLATRQDTGGGGQEIALRLVGVGRFAGADQALHVHTVPAEPEDVTRRKVLDTASVGFLALLARDGLPAGVSVGMRSTAAQPSRVAADPWNLWVFEVSGDGSFQSEESNKQTRWEGQVTADRVTDRWKISLGATVEQERETFEFDDKPSVNVTRREREVEWFFAKSLGEHWSFGIDGDVTASTFSNIRLQYETSPAIEFNVFPYSQYAVRQLRAQYALGPEQSRYNELTFYDLTEETRLKHEASVTLDQREPWGSLNLGLEWSQYLHDLSKSRLEVQGEVALRIARGLSLTVEGSASRIRDRLSLPKRGATSEEVLLRLRQLQSGHEVQLSVGVSYSFGSLFNNIVNPRFGR